MNTAELINSTLPDLYINFQQGKSHLYDGQKIACGLDLDRLSNYTVDTFQSRNLCQRCQATRDWFFQTMIEP